MNVRACLLAICTTLWVLVGCKHEPDAAAPTPLALNVPAYFGKAQDTSEAPLTVEGVALGKALFFNTGLSADGKVSCASCHRPEAAFSDPRPVSLGVNGLPGTRNAMAIVNMAYTSHYFWDGRVDHLREQVQQPMTQGNEMGMTIPEIEEKLKAGLYPALFAKAFQGAEPSMERAKTALSMFCRSLVSYNSKYDKYLRGEAALSEQELRGLTLFSTHPVPDQHIRGANCMDCHKTITLAGENQADLFQNPLKGFANNGLDQNPVDPGVGAVTGKVWQRGRFRIPTLRNIALTAPYMHDGRFQTLEQVLDHYNDSELFRKPGVDSLILLGSNYRSYASLGLTDEEKTDVIAFLHTLTDTTYLHP